MILELYLFFFKLGLFSFGGGYAMIPLIQQEVVASKGWMTQAELVDMIAISQMTPGPIAVNLATYLGYDKAGILGSISATVGVITPSFIIMTVFWILMKRLEGNPYFSYFLEGLRPIVIGLVLSGFISVAPTSMVDIATLVIFLLVFYLVHSRDMNPILAIVAGAVAGIVIY